MSSKLIVAGVELSGEQGIVMDITPESAGWTYVGFRVHKLKARDRVQGLTGEREVCLVILSGKINVTTTRERWENIGERMNVFERTAPYSVYIPSGDRYGVEALTEAEVAVCSAPGKGSCEARLIEPADVGVQTRGSGSTERIIHNILPETEPADSLLVVEVFTPEGHWSSYPPHKHDRDRLPEESYLEETYYYKIDREQGFALQRIYTDERDIDETLLVRSGEAVLVPRGYHPVSAPPGYNVYYLNVMAGPVRTWKFYNDPEHEWIMNR